MSPLQTLISGRSLFIGEDPNLEMFLTPGHAGLPDFKSMVVHNVPDLGSVALVSDLFRTKDDVQLTVIP